MFTEAVYRKPLIIMLMLMAIQQLGGVNAIIMYLNTIFIAAGTDLDDALQGGGQLSFFVMQITSSSLFTKDILDFDISSQYMYKLHKCPL